MTAAEAANFLRIHPTTLRRLVREGRLQRDSGGGFEVGPLVRIRQQQPAPVQWRHDPPSQEAIQAATDAERWEWALALFGGWGNPIIVRSAADLQDLHQRIENAWRLAGPYVKIEPIAPASPEPAAM